MTSEDDPEDAGQAVRRAAGAQAAAEPDFTDNAEEAEDVPDSLRQRVSKPLPLVPAEDQFENTVGKAMNDMFAKIATGGTVTDADIKAALQARRRHQMTVG